MKSTTVALVAAALSLAAAQGATATTYSNLIVFGDSNVDIGRLAVALTPDNVANQVLPPPNTVGGRSADGTILPEFVEMRTGTPQLNFGWGGATAGPDNIVGLLGAPHVLLTGTLTQIDEFETMLGGGPADPMALYLVFAGSNNLFFADKNDQSAVDAAVAEADAQLREGVTRLAQLGAEKIVVATRTPRPVLSEADTISDEPDTDARNDASGRQLNTAIRALVLDLDATLAADVLLFDVDAIIRDIIAGSGSNGFLAYDSAASQFCINNLDCSMLINFDGAHKTSAVHSVLADHFIRQFDVERHPAPIPLPAAAWMLLAAMATLAALARGRRNPGVA